MDGGSGVSLANSSWRGRGGLGPRSLTYLLCGHDDEFTAP